jgi:hypothetical protein
MLELLTRRHPIEAEEGREGETCVHLVDWVLESFDKQPLSILDNSLLSEDTVNNENQIEQIMLLMRVGLLCTQKEPQKRPDMTDVVGILNQILETGLNRVGHPSVVELTENIVTWNYSVDPTTSESKSLKFDLSL